MVKENPKKPVAPPVPGELMTSFPGKLPSDCDHADKVETARFVKVLAIVRCKNCNKKFTVEGAWQKDEFYA